MQSSNTDRTFMTIDGTDCPVNQKFDPTFYSHKFKDSGVRYEVGLCIRTGWIVWISGPYPCGSWSDLTIFRHDLKNQLLQNELVEADQGYRGDEKALEPNICFTQWQYDMKFILRARHEHVNQRLKTFAVLQNCFRHRLSQNDLNKHRICFNVAAVITQLNIQTHSPLAQVFYQEYI